MIIKLTQATREYLGACFLSSCLCVFEYTAVSGAHSSQITRNNRKVNSLLIPAKAKLRIMRADDVTAVVTSMIGPRANPCAAFLLSLLPISIFRLLSAPKCLPICIKRFYKPLRLVLRLSERVTSALFFSNISALPDALNRSVFRYLIFGNWRRLPFLILSARLNVWWPQFRFPLLLLPSHRLENFGWHIAT